jgi:hypothetical protein
MNEKIDRRMKLADLIEALEAAWHLAMQLDYEKIADGAQELMEHANRRGKWNLAHDVA